MDYLVIVKTSKGYDHFNAQTSEQICRYLNSYPGVEHFSVVGLPDPVNDPLPLKKQEYEDGKWYKYQNLMVVFQGRTEPTYGKVDKGWLISATVDWNYSWQPAEVSEIFETLKAEAHRRYEGEALTVDSKGHTEVFADVVDMTYSTDRNALVAYWDSGKCMDLFRRGVWSTPAPKPKKTELFGIKNYTDKELRAIIDQLSDELIKRRK